MSTDAPVKTAAAQKAAPAFIKMLLRRNYRPRGEFRIVGYDRPERVAKDAGGREFVVEPASFVDGEMKPPRFHGVGTEGKIWADTVVELPEDEARDLRKRGIAEAYI